MKSIKEKAGDIQIGYDDIQAPAIGRGFVLGANYVLEELEKFQKLFSTCMNAHANGYLTSVIEQLKGK